MIKVKRDGFTLMEVAIAIFILAAALTTLIALQSAASNRALKDQRMTKSMLAARQILGNIEARTLPLDIQDLQQPARQLLELQEGSIPLASEDIDRLSAALKVEYWGLPDLPQALKRATLSISWDDNPSDRYDIYYFIPNDDEELFNESFDDE